MSERENTNKTEVEKTTSIRFIDRNGKKILQQLVITSGPYGSKSAAWTDVPFVSEGRNHA